MANNPLLQNSPSLQTSQIADAYIKKNFQNLIDYFAQNNQLLGFKFFEVSLSSAQKNYLVAHGLGYIPKDIMVTQVTGVGQATFNFGLFDSANINITTTGACRIRFFAGTYYNQQSTVQANTSDIWVANGVSSVTPPSFYTGSGAPTKTTANLNDGYMDIVTGHIYIFTNNTWSIIRRAGSKTYFSKQSYTTNFAGNAFGPSSLTFAIDENLQPLQVIIPTKGGEVDVGFMPNPAIMAGNTNSPLSVQSSMTTDQSPTNSGIFLVFYRDGVPICTHTMYMQNNVSIEIHEIPMSAFWFTDVNVPAGEHTYTCKGQLTNNARSTNNIANSVMFARERAT